MNYSTPEKMGISSSDIEEYIKVLESSNLSTHNLIIMRHGNIVFEKYWAPFHKDFIHRMYSVTKSFVSLAIGFLEQDGKLDLDAPVLKYFPDELKNQKDENMRSQTIRNMLTMSTAKPERYWFGAKTDDRVRFYFENDLTETRPPGTVYMYDSTGSFVLGALVERICGKSIMEYLREKLFDKIGVSKDAYMLKCPGGHSWSDSALLCKPMDLLKVAMFCMNKGKWNEEQILNEEYIVKATSKQIDNNPLGLNEYNTQGYGYQFWRSFDNSFWFNGMGDQVALCIPDKDMIMVYNGDNQGFEGSRKIVLDNFFKLVARRAEDKELPQNKKAEESLKIYADTLKLSVAKGDKHNVLEDKINGVTYVLGENNMGITKMTLMFDGDKGKLLYTNAQGDKEIPFGMCKNEFAPFPQMGYSDMVGTKAGNILYNCASSAAWVSDNQLFIKVQIIDKYFGRLNINLGFTNDGKKIGVNMNKTAEDFLEEYCGYADGEAS